MPKFQKKVNPEAPKPAWRNRIVGHGEEEPAKLLANPKNWRLHPKVQTDALAGVLSEVGWVQDVIVNQRSGFIVDGHARVELAKARGERVPVVFVDLSDKEEALILASLDPLAAMAETNKDALASLVGSLEVSDASVKAMLAELVGPGVTAGLTDEDAVPDVPAAPVTVAGDLWLLGDHRLLVGDATLAAAADRLMAGEAADMVFTDPPYNVAYQGYTEEKLTIQSDSMSPADFRLFLEQTFASYRAATKAEASVYVCHSSSWQREFQNALELAGFDVRCQIIWAKNTFAWGFARYKFQHEPMFYCHVAGQKDEWYGDKSQSTLWEENKPAANRLHPTMKPVELVERALVNSSKAGDLVADFFGGSGTTLIACERLGRKARLMELDPKYADVIVKRWQEFSGKEATLDGDGRTFAQLAAERVGAQATAFAEASTE